MRDTISGCGDLDKENSKLTFKSLSVANAANC